MKKRSKTSLFHRGLALSSFFRGHTPTRSLVISISLFYSFILYSTITRRTHAQHMSSSTSTVANYNGRQPNNTAYIKTFVSGPAPAQWKTVYINGQPALTPANPSVPNLSVPGNIYLGGSIIQTSDAAIKKEVVDVSEEQREKLMQLQPKRYKLKWDPAAGTAGSRPAATDKPHFGFIAQEVAAVYPDLVQRGMNGLQSVNYLEMVPLLVAKVQDLQRQVDELRAKKGEE